MNYSGTNTIGYRIVVALNAAGALISAGFGLVAMLDPALVLPGTDASAAVEIYAWAYGMRAVPLGAAVLILLTTQGKRGLIPVLLISGIAQLADAVIGARHGIPGMLAGGSALAAIHLGSAAWLARRLP
jgi:hypothetical protein